MRVRLYCYIIMVLAAAAVLATASAGYPVVWSVVLLLGPLTLIAEWLAFPLGRGESVSLASPLAFAAVLLGGPLTGALVVLFGAVSPRDLSEHKPLYRIGFNTAQFILTAIAAGLVYVAVAGDGALMAASGGADFSGTWWLAAFLAAVTLAAVNLALVGIAISISSQVPVIRVWQSVYKTYLVNQPALSLLGLVLAQLVAVSGALGVLLLVVPFAVARQTFAAYRELSEAYTDTLRSLVTLIEAKDPYTRGHSERVAVYARGIADALGVPQSDAQSIEYAALLHDVGKVGVAAATLTKPGALSAEEYDEVKLHPVTAARVLADVELLQDTLPLIEAHHERLDGSGYPYGLVAEAIPRGAQVLAVADSFDAMTSTRSYRPAMSHNNALAELENESDARLASDCVSALREAILAGVFAELGESGYDWEVEAR